MSGVNGPLVGEGNDFAGFRFVESVKSGHGEHAEVRAANSVAQRHIAGLAGDEHSIAIHGDNGRCFNPRYSIRHARLLITPALTWQNISDVTMRFRTAAKRLVENLGVTQPC